MNLLNSSLAIAVISSIFASTSIVIAAEPAEPAKAQPAKEAVKAPEADYTILKVDGSEIKKSDVLNVWKSLFPEGETPDFDGFDDKIRQNVLRGVASERLVKLAAEKAKFAESAEVKAKMAQIHDKLISQSFLESTIAKNVSDADVKAAYEVEVKKLSATKEAHARHILVASKEEALKVKKRINGGEDFAKVAKELSSDKGSGANGGDLGFFTADRMVPEFSKAAFALKVGKISEPVQSQFGWHIIKLEELRDQKAPSFDELKGKIRDDLRNKAVRKYIDELLNKSSIQYFDKTGKQMEFSTKEAEKPAQ